MIRTYAPSRSEFCSFDWGYDSSDRKRSATHLAVLQTDALPLNTIRASLQRVTRLVVLQRAFGRLYSFVSDVVLMTYSHSGSAPSWVVSLV